MAFMTKSKLHYRCPWAKDEIYAQYHDLEWGVPVHDDRLLFEFLILEGAQAGLSWETILKKRDNYREAFDQFDPAIVAKYGQQKAAELAGESGHRSQPPEDRLRHQQRPGVSGRAGRIRQLRQVHLGIRRRPSRSRTPGKSIKDVPARTPQSDAMSKDLKRRGFKFVGSTICYAFMQAAGMVNDHLVDCFRHAELRPRTRKR